MILEDTRVGGEVRHILTDKPLMFIPDDMRKCVAYIGYRMADGSYRLAGSAFFVGRTVADDIPELMFGYVVTARHVIDSIRGKGIASVLLRVNSATGLKWIETDVTKWHLHPDSSIDVAVFRKSLTDDLDHRQWPVHGFLTAELISKEGVGIGEDVFFMGLFSQHYGTTKNIPIARIGNIAAMPDEPVATKLGPMQAYLVESRSIGGLSGSPVFVNTGGSPPRGALVGTFPRFRLLGVMHGHFDVDESEQDSIADDGLERAPVNMGIAIVVPAEKILGIIELFSNDEKIMEQKHRAKKLPTMD